MTDTQASAGKPVIAVIGTGGTISSVGRSPLDLYDYAETKKKYEADELTGRFTQLEDVARILPIRFRAVGSPSIGGAEWLEMVEIIHRTVAEHPEVTGFVITHGTATLEETAWFLNLALKTDRPVVVVGAQRPSSGLSTDSDMNLLNAVRVAADPQSRGLGVLVVLNDEIQAAREVTKTSTFRLQTFRSPDVGVLGHADADRIIYFRRPWRRCAPDTEFDVSGLSELPRVDIAYAYAGTDGTAVDAFVAKGARGIVSAGMAPGSTAPAEVDALTAAKEKGITIVQSTRVGSGRVLPLAPLLRKGFVPGDNLNPQKARILLMLALTVTDDPTEITRIFETY